LLGKYSFIDFWSYHLCALSLASEVHGYMHLQKKAVAYSQFVALSLSNESQLLNN
jgi:hypothetical protein